MSAGQHSTLQHSSWTEPPWSGWIETTGDALLILEAARRGLIPRVTRRLVDAERKMITSGSVFVFDEDESGIKRWTDGFYWSPSRILGNFLLYRETDKRGAGHRTARNDPDTSEGFANENPKADGSLSRPKNDTLSISVDKHRERTLMGSLTNSYKFKPDGLMKKTFSLTIAGVAQHLISYYKIEDVENGRLRCPSSLPELASLDISPEYLDKTHFRNPPKVEIGVDGIPRYRGEADDIDTSSSILSAPLSTGMPLLTEGRLADPAAMGAGPSGAVKRERGKRYEPYGSPPIPKRTRRNTKTSQPEEDSPIDDGPVTPEAASASSTPQPTPQQIQQQTSQQANPPAALPGYPDPNVPFNLGMGVGGGLPQMHPPPGTYAAYGIPPFYPGYPPPHMYGAPPHGPAMAQQHGAIPYTAPGGPPPAPGVQAAPQGIGVGGQQVMSYGYPPQPQHIPPPLAATSSSNPGSSAGSTPATPTVSTPTHHSAGTNAGAPPYGTQSSAAAQQQQQVHGSDPSQAGHAVPPPGPPSSSISTPNTTTTGAGAGMAQAQTPGPATPIAPSSVQAMQGHPGQPQPTMHGQPPPPPTYYPQYYHPHAPPHAHHAMAPPHGYAPYQWAPPSAYPGYPPPPPMNAPHHQMGVGVPGVGMGVGVPGMGMQPLPGMGIQPAMQMGMAQQPHAYMYHTQPPPTHVSPQPQQQATAHQQVHAQTQTHSPAQSPHSGTGGTGAGGGGGGEGDDDGSGEGEDD